VGFAAQFIMFDHLLSTPIIWNIIQRILGAPEFKKRLYSSVLAPGGRLLDFGCANGHTAGTFLQHEHYDVDLDVRTIRHATRAYRAHTSMHLICADLRRRPFPRDYFDKVPFAATVHPVTAQMFLEILIEMHRSLKPKGTIHIIDPVRQPSDGWQARLLRSLDRGCYSRTEAQIRDLVQATRVFEMGASSLHRPFGALIWDCDFVHLPVKKLT
jgi:SAM-dependent methyltransferase